MEAVNAQARPFRLKSRHIVGASAALCGLGCMLFLCLRPTGNFGTLGLPDSALIRWMDAHGELRNLPAFAVLTMPFMFGLRRASRRRWATYGLLFLSAAVEGVQLFLPSRVPSLADIFWSWAGIALVAVAAEAIWERVETRLRRKAGVRRQQRRVLARARLVRPAIARA